MRLEHDVEVEVRSYEIDGFGHLNHAVFLNHFEFARFKALEAIGLPPEALLAEGMGIHVVRVEVDYVREARLGQRVRIRTTVEEVRNSSMVLSQESSDPADLALIFARARVTAVWVGPNRRPMRIPDRVRDALGHREAGNPSES